MIRKHCDKCDATLTTEESEPRTKSIGYVDKKLNTQWHNNAEITISTSAEITQPFKTEGSSADLCNKCLVEGLQKLITSLTPTTTTSKTV